MTSSAAGDRLLASTYTEMGHTLASGATRCPTCGEPTVRVGTDVQEIEAVAAGLARHGERYLQRLFTEQEVADARGADSGWTDAGVASLAARYAAKESVIKVLRPVHTGMDWTLIEIVRHPAGWAMIDLHGRAGLLAGGAGLSAWAISFAHDGGVAVATVLARHACHDGTVPEKFLDLGE